jgi:hypothetical protein
MKSPQRGEVWVVDLGMVAKVRSHPRGAWPSQGRARRAIR